MARRGFRSARSFRRDAANARVYRNTGVLSTSAEMLDLRAVNIGMYPTFFLIELGEGFELPEAVHESATVVELKRLSSRLVALGNEIGGLAKDLAGNWPNIVVALKQERGLSLEDAFDSAIRLHNTEVETFDALVRQLPVWGADVDAQLEGFIQAVRHSTFGFTLMGVAGSPLPEMAGAVRRQASHGARHDLRSRRGVSQRSARPRRYSHLAYWSVISGFRGHGPMVESARNDQEESTWRRRQRLQKRSPDRR